MKTLKQLLSDLINSRDISGAFDEDGALTDIYASKKAERDIACWYLADGELLAEATAGHEKELAYFLKNNYQGSFVEKVIKLCEAEALKWAKANEWDYMESELTQDFNARTEPEPDFEYSSFRADVFSALDPVAITKAMEGK